MLNGQKIVVVMPAYNAARTLQRTYDEVMAQGIVDLVIVVDDASHDETVAIARTLKDVQVEVHPENRGYGGNQKTCYRLALAAGADIVVMIHPDYQYTPQLLPAMASLVASGLYPCVLASRILGGGALDGGMPWWKYIANRFLTFAENFLIGAKLSEYHTGYRAFARGLLERVPIEQNSDDFVFDNQMLAQIIWLGSKIGEVTCRRNIYRKGRRLTFGEACATASVVSGRRCVFAWPAGDCFRHQFNDADSSGAGQLARRSPNHDRGLHFSDCDHLARFWTNTRP